MSDQLDQEIIPRELSTDTETPAVQIAEIVAELEGKDTCDLTTMYDHVDHVLEHIFSDPPVPEAQIEITFTYEGYRVSVEQDGFAEFVSI